MENIPPHCITISPTPDIGLESTDEELRDNNVNDLQYPTCPSTPHNATVLEPPTAPQKTSKWYDLPKQDHSMHKQCLPARFSPNEDEMDSHVALVTIDGPSMNEPLKTPQAENWQRAIDAKYC